MGRWLEADLLERGLKERAVFETIATASAHHDLLHDAVEVDADAAAEQHVHVLERNSSDMCAREARQRLEGGLDRTVPADASQVGVEIERAHRQSIESTACAAGCRCSDSA